MAARAPSAVVGQVLSLRHPVRNAHRASSPAPPRGAAFPGRRDLVLLSLTWTASAAVAAAPAKAEDIGLFGIRKKLKEAERETEVIVKEGFEAAEKGIETAEKGLETAEKGVEAAEKGIETVAGFGGLAQAGLVAGAEVLGVVVASSVVNAILRPEN
ncbi:uncharacterized protein LOC133727308 [Rosa rugosa]|uniref:uncharacterized protein LOC133727308 n=1 Tax=Rosa rugosa TaxID=74645 RepID=UPI002B412067|nr:uncharacterized protein LOC133727308 [Rosa rugosa]